MIRAIAVAGGLAAMLTCAGTAQAAKVLHVEDGRGRMVRDALLPPSGSARLLLPGKRTALVVPPLGRVAALPVAVDVALADARRTRDALPAGPARDEPPA